MTTSSAKTPLSPIRHHYTGGIRMYGCSHNSSTKASIEKRGWLPVEEPVHNMSSGHEVTIFIYGWAN